MGKSVKRDLEGRKKGRQTGRLEGNWSVSLSVCLSVRAVPEGAHSLVGTHACERQDRRQEQATPLSAKPRQGTRGAELPI